MIERQEKIRNKISEENLNAVLAFHPANTFYMSGFQALSYSRPIIVLYPLNSSPTLIVPSLDEEFAKSSWINDIKMYSESPVPFPAKESTDPISLLLDVITEKGLKRGSIGFEEKSLPFQTYEVLRKEMPRAELKPCSNFFMELRIIKERDELDLIRKACKLTDFGVTSSINHVKEGVTEIQVSAEGDKAILTEASECYKEFKVWPWQLFSSTLSGPLTVFPHGVSTSRTIHRGDTILHSRGAPCNGYRGECERTVFLGSPIGLHEKVYEVVSEAQRKAIDKVRPGIRACDVDKVARKIIDNAGYGKYFVHRTGHGIGIEGHELPFLRYDDQTVLEPGMVFSIEPAIYLPGMAGFRHSDTILVTEEGHEVLTMSPKYKVL